jgi:hypothetical protein
MMVVSGRDERWKEQVTTPISQSAILAFGRKSSTLATPSQPPLY